MRVDQSRQSSAKLRTITRKASRELKQLGKAGER
jgi:hypothetical protein